MILKTDLDCVFEKQHYGSVQTEVGGVHNSVATPVQPVQVHIVGATGGEHVLGLVEIRKARACKPVATPS